MDNKATSHWPITLTNGAATLCNLFLPVALVRLMSPEDVGRYKAFFLYVMLAPSLFAVSGLVNGLYHWAGAYPRTQREVRQSWTWLSGMALGLSGLGLAGAAPLAHRLGLPLLDLHVFFLFCPFGLAAVFMEDLMIARGDIWRGSFYGAGFQVLRTASVLAAAWWFRTLDAVLWTFLASTVLRAFVGWRMLAPTGDLEPAWSRDISANVLRYAFPASIAALAGLALSRVDQLMLSFRLAPADFAFYTMGCLSLPPLQVLEISVNRVMIPRLSRAFADRNPADAAAIFAEGVLELFRFMLPAALGLMIFSRPIMRVLFTDRYIDAAPYLRVYALFYLSLALPFDVVARAIGDAAWTMRTLLLFAPVSIVATWLAIRGWGAMGALIVLLVLQFALRLYALSYQKHHCAVSLSRFLPLREMASHTGWALAASALALAMRPLFTDDRTWFFISGALFPIVYFGGLQTRPRARTSETSPIPVLELVQYLSVGGLERMVFSLSQALRRQKQFSPFVASYDRLEDDRSSLAPRFEEAGIPFIQWQKKSGFSPIVVTRLLKIIFSRRNHILHAHDLGPLIYGSIAKVLSFGRVRLVVTLHTLLQVQKNRRYRIYFKFFLRFADRIVAVSPAVKTGLTGLAIAPERIEVVANGAAFTASRGRNLSSLTDHKRKILPGAPASLYQASWILYMARLHQGKGQDVALDIWRALSAQTRAKLGLIFVGPETEPAFAQSLRQTISRLPDAERVVMAGPTQDPHAWIQASHLFISASNHEGMPLAPLEAAGSGLPVLLSQIPGHAFLKPYARYFDLTRADDGARRITALLLEIAATGETAFFEQQWKAGAPLRREWSETAMAASYMNVFQSLKLHHPRETETPNEPNTSLLLENDSILHARL